MSYKKRQEITGLKMFDYYTVKPAYNEPGYNER